MRAAVAEVEDYTRIEVTGASAAAVTGDVVADVIHLLAELIENATAYSPPTTEVTVKVETVANGLAVEVVDRGIGLHPDELDALNQRLANAVEFDLVDTERLGLFVVARLAARHDVKVSLQPSAYGGPAIVLIPHALVVMDEQWHAIGEGATVTQPVASGASSPRLGRPIRPALPGPAAARPPRHGPPDTPPPVSFNPPGSFAEPGSFDAAGSFEERGRSRSRAPTTRRSPTARPSPSIRRSRSSRPDTPMAGPGRRTRIRNRPGRRTARSPAAFRAGCGSATSPLSCANVRCPGRPSARPDDDFEEPSPELSRDLMASLQSGWLRGRIAEDEPGDLDPRDEWGNHDAAGPRHRRARLAARRSGATGRRGSPGHPAVP